jgi:primosomal protein N''
LFDAEPAISAALNAGLEKLLASAIERHAAWLAEALAAEQAAIARERTKLNPLIRARDATHNDARKLAALIAQDELAVGATG